MPYVNVISKLHGALLDTEILAEVYLVMTGGQVSLLAQNNNISEHSNNIIKPISEKRARLTILAPTYGYFCSFRYFYVN